MFTFKKSERRNLPGWKHHGSAQPLVFRSVKIQDHFPKFFFFFGGGLVSRNSKGPKTSQWEPPG